MAQSTLLAPLKALLSLIFGICIIFPLVFDHFSFLDNDIVLGYFVLYDIILCYMMYYFIHCIFVNKDMRYES